MQFGQQIIGVEGRRRLAGQRRERPGPTLPPSSGPRRAPLAPGPGSRTRGPRPAVAVDHGQRGVQGEKPREAPVPGLADIRRWTTSIHSVSSVPRRLRQGRAVDGGVGELSAPLGGRPEPKS